MTNVEKANLFLECHKAAAMILNSKDIEQVRKLANELFLQALSIL